MRLLQLRAIRLPLLLLLLLLLLLAGCGASAETRVRLPTVTDEPPPTATILTTPTTPRPSATAVVIPTPTEPAVLQTEDGPVTWSMAELKIGAERYATLGDPAAPITILDYSDYGCPSCQQFELVTFPQLRERYIDTGKVYYVYKDFPVVSQQGGPAAQAAECAGEQGRYWEMHAQLFLSPSEWEGAQERAYETFRRYAETLGLDAERLDQCVRDERFRPEIEADLQEGFDNGLSGTPSFLINGKLLPGAQPLDVFVEVLDKLLAS